MKRIILTIMLIFASLPWLDSPSAKRAAPPLQLRAAMDPAVLRDLAPASALLAIEVRDLNRRWREIRSTKSLAGFQDGLLSCAGIPPGLVPVLAGDQAVVFLAPMERRPFLLPVAILRPPDMQQAEETVNRFGQLAHLRARGALWLGPAGWESTLGEFARAENASLGDVLPFAEIEDRLPEGGLVRGWVNPAAWADFLRDHRDRVDDTLFQWVASAAAAELTAVRYIAFRRDLKDGELGVDGIIAYDASRLPPEVSEVLNPGASPASLPSELPSNTIALAAFRPEARAWLPWLQYLAANDPHGPLRNAGFWINEFQQRYRRDLERDLFRALGERAWLIASLAEDARSVELAWIFEVREGRAVESTMLDLVSWLGEQIRLRTLVGTVFARSKSAALPGTEVHGLWLQTPFSRIPGPSFQVSGGYLIIAGNPATMQAGRALAAKISLFDTGTAAANTGLPAHGAMLVQGAELARLIQSSDRTLNSSACMREAIAMLAAGFESLRIEIRYEHDAVRFHDRLILADQPEGGRQPR